LEPTGSPQKLGTENVNLVTIINLRELHGPQCYSIGSTLKEAKRAVGGVKLAVMSEKSNFFLIGARQQNVLFQFFHKILQKGDVFSTKP